MTIVRTITVKEDVGTHEPSYRRTELALHDDGTVTWLRSWNDDWPEGETRPEARP